MYKEKAYSLACVVCVVLLALSLLLSLSGGNCVKSFQLNAPSACCRSQKTQLN